MPIPTTIKEYLSQLNAALADADPALRQDALYDAEEYLRSELAEHPEWDEAAMLAKIATSYGAPEEVADIYRDKEVQVESALRAPPKKASRKKISPGPCSKAALTHRQKTLHWSIRQWAKCRPGKFRPNSWKKSRSAIWRWTAPASICACAATAREPSSRSCETLSPALRLRISAEESSGSGRRDAFEITIQSAIAASPHLESRYQADNRIRTVFTLHLSPCFAV